MTGKPDGVFNVKTRVGVGALDSEVTGISGSNRLVDDEASSEGRLVGKDDLGSINGRKMVGVEPLAAILDRGTNKFLLGRWDRGEDLFGDEASDLGVGLANESIGRGGRVTEVCCGVSSVGETVLTISVDDDSSSSGESTGGDITGLLIHYSRKTVDIGVSNDLGHDSTVDWLDLFVSGYDFTEAEEAGSGGFIRSDVSGLPTVKIGIGKLKVPGVAGTPISPSHKTGNVEWTDYSLLKSYSVGLKANVAGDARGTIQNSWGPSVHPRSGKGLPGPLDYSSLQRPLSLQSGHNGVG